MDKKADLAVAAAGSGVVSVLLSNGDGTFQPHVDYLTNPYPQVVTVGDFNADGKPDLAVGTRYYSTVSILIGNGDGTFRPRADYLTAPDPAALAVIDANRDGKMDLAVAGRYSGAISVHLGKGDGTFSGRIDSRGGYSVYAMAAGEFNGDGKVDLAVGHYGYYGDALGLMFGEGDGTFRIPMDFDYPLVVVSLAAVDLNGDGEPDLAGAVAGSTPRATAILRTVGWSPHPRVDLWTGGSDPWSLVSADFNDDGGPDLAISNQNDTVSVLLNFPIIDLFPTAVSFGNQRLGTASSPRSITLTNAGAMPLTLSGVMVSGDFTLSSSCPQLPATLKVGARCTLGISFKPTAHGTHTGAVTITDNAARGVQVVPLVGTGVRPVAVLSASSLDFPSQLVGTTSTSQAVTLSNTGDASLTLASIATSTEFSVTHTCGSSVAPGAECTLNVSFRPAAAGSRSGTLTLTTDASGSPHVINLSGTGTDFSLAVASGSSSSATVTAGETATYTLTLDPEGFIGTVSLSCTGAPRAATCTVSPGSVDLDGSTSVNVTVTVQTTARAAAPPLPTPPVSPSGRWDATPQLPILAALALLSLLAGLRRRRATCALTATLALLLLWAACGGGAGPAPPPTTGTPAGTYTLTVTATAGAASRSTTLSLRVN